MIEFREYVCWRDDAVLATTPRDAASLLDGHFQAIHHPLRLRRRRLDDRSGGRWVTEFDVIDALQGVLRPDGYLFIPIVGGSGTGKSHLVRWIKDQTENVDNWECRYLPKNRTGIRRAIEIVIRGLSGTKIDEAREALEAAPAHTERDDVLAERLLDELALLVARTDDLPVDTSTHLSEYQLQLRQKLGRQLPDVLRDPVVRRKLVAPGAVIHRLVGLAVRGRQEGDGLDDAATRFLDSDLPLTFEEIGDTSRGARALLGQFATIPDLLSAAVSLINEALPIAEKRISVSGTVDLVEIFREVRRALLADGRELVLFIEDLTVLHGVEREFLDAIVEPARSPDGDMCNLRIVFAVTDGHFDDLDTVRTRCDDGYWLDAQYGDEGGVDEDEALSFLGRYLNSSRLSPDEIERSWTARYDGHWLSNACTPCPHRDTCHETFGSSAEGYGLYPLNAMSAGRFVEALSTDRFDPRVVVREVINRFLIQGAVDMPQSTFPSDAALLAFDGETEPLSPLLATELRTLRPTDHERVINTLRYWSERDSHTSIKLAVLDAFGIDSEGFDLESLHELGSGIHLDQKTAGTSDISDQSTSLEEQLHGKWRSHFSELTQWSGRTRDLSARATNDLRKLVHKTITDNLEYGPTAVHIGTEFTSHRFRAEPHIGIEGTVTQQSLEAAMVVIERTEASAAALQGLILGAELDTDDSPLASNYRRLLASSVEIWTNQVVDQITGPPSSVVVSAVEGLIVASAVVGVLKSGDAPEVLDAMFRATTQASATTLPRTDRWTSLTSQAAELIPQLRSTVETEFGESRGSRGSVRAILADRLLPIIETFTTDWALDSLNPAFAPFMRSATPAIDEEWTVLSNRVGEAIKHVDRERPWHDQTAKVLEVLRAAHNAGRLRDAAALETLSVLASIEPDRVLQSFFQAAELVAKSRSTSERLLALGGTTATDVAVVHGFMTRAASAIEGVEKDLTERQAASGLTDMESVAEQVLNATTRFASSARELGE